MQRDKKINFLLYDNTKIPEMLSKRVQNQVAVLFNTKKAHRIGELTSKALWHAANIGQLPEEEFHIRRTVPKVTESFRIGVF